MSLSRDRLSRSAPGVPNRRCARTWARPTAASSRKRCARRLASCSKRSTNSPPCCAVPCRTSTISTSRNGRGGSARCCARPSTSTPHPKTTCSTDERPAPVLRSPARPLHAVFHRDVGALQLLRDAGIPHPVHDESARFHRSACRPRVRQLRLERLAHADHRRLHRRPLAGRSEEHTSELQSPCNLVCRLL